MTRKNFGSPKNENTDPIDFDLFKETFECRPALQGPTLLKYSIKFGSDDDAVVNQAFLDFFETVLKPESYVRMKALWDDEDKIVPIETLGNIMEWLIEQYTARPTTASEES